MANYKQNKRRRGGIKGCCYICSLATTDGRRNGRVPTLHERKIFLTLREEVNLLKGYTPLKPYRLNGREFW